jgi:hypothetical protein
MPQPPVGFSLQSLAPRRGRVRLSASPCSLAVLRRASSPRARTRPFHSGFHRRPRLSTRWPGSPPELGHRFHRACAYARIGFPGALTTPAHLGEWKSPASSASKPRSPREAVPTAPPKRDRRPLLSWASPLQSLAPIEPRDLIPCGPFRPPRASLRDDEERSPRRQVKPDDLAAATTSWAPDPQGDCGSARAASRRQPCLPRPCDGPP